MTTAGPFPVSEIVASRRPHRKDAARNYDALITAAREAFAEHGADVSLEDIARRAGVGIGTLYRNFPTRRDHR
ncbi:helix-turn-helix domain-containing protein, partial [Streptomyces sp. NPDC005921]